MDDLRHRPPTRLTMRERKIPLKAGLVELGVVVLVALKPTGEVGCDDVAVFVGDEVSPWSQVDVGWGSPGPNGLVHRGRLNDGPRLDSEKQLG